MTRKPSAVSAKGRHDQAEQSLGLEISTRRRALGLTLNQLAARTGLSQPFLSQIERGSAQPSMRSLSAIANALGTSGPVLLAGMRYHELNVGGRSTSPARMSDRSVDRNLGVARSLIHADGPVGVTEFVGVGPQDEGEWYVHDDHECIYVAQGAIEFRLGDSEPQILRAHESLNYDGSIPHRWHMVDDDVSLVLMFSYPNFENMRRSNARERKPLPAKVRRSGPTS